MSRLALLVILACFWTASWAFSTGPPDSICTTMTPGHGAGDTSSLGSSYTVTTSANQYSPGSKITVTISGNGATNFKGFMIQVRTVGGTNAVGSITTTAANERSACSGAAATHNTNADKASVSVDWTAPSTSVGDVQVWATIVQTKLVWTTVKRSIITAASVTGGSTAPGGSTAAGGSTASTTTTTTTTTTPPPISSMKPIVTSACGSTKSCFKNSIACGTDCEYLLTWEPVGDEIQFEMSGISDGYIAVGFSKDMQMGDDNVIACTNRGTVSNNYQFNKAGPGPIDPNNLHFGLSSTAGGSDGPGRISCSFSRKKSFSGARKKRARDASQVFDLANSYYLFFARGPVDSNDNVQQHTNIPAVSAKQADFSSNHQLLAGEADRPLAKAHACLMLIAWVGLASTGILMARYYKPQWSSSKLCGEKVWFAVHRTLMISVVLLNIIALLLILAELNWTWSLQVAHPIIGIIVIGLAFVQPIMAFFRPHPDGKNRWIFNWAHWFVGTSAHILSAPAIFLGMRTPRLYLPDYALYIMIAFVVWHVFIDIILEIYQCYVNYSKKKNRPEEYPMGIQKDVPAPPPDNRGHFLRQVIIVLYVIVTAGLLTAMVVITAKYPN